MVEVFGLWVATVILYCLKRPKSVIILIKNENSLFFNRVPPAKMMENHCYHPQIKNLNLYWIWSYGVFSLGHRYKTNIIRTKSFETSFSTKKVTLIFVTRWPLPVKMVMSSYEWFFLFFSENTIFFSKNLQNNKIFGT